MLYLIFFGLGVLTGAALVLHGKETEEKAGTSPKFPDLRQNPDGAGQDLESTSKAILEFWDSKDSQQYGFDPDATNRRPTRLFSDDEFWESAENLRRSLRR